MSYTKEIAPTLFMSNDEVREAVAVGYIGNSQGTAFGYEENGDNIDRLPVMFWGGDSDTRQSFQPNLTSSRESDVLLNREYLCTLKKAVKWEEIRDGFIAE